MEHDHGPQFHIVYMFFHIRGLGDKLVVDIPPTRLFSCERTCRWIDDHLQCLKFAGSEELRSGN